MDALALHLDAGLGSLGLDLAADRRAALIAFLRLLHRWNRIYNLSGIRDPDAMVARHLLDSLAVLPYLYGQRLLDIGSGAGIPGMVLALADPDREWVLLDRSLKKIRFLRQVLIELEPGRVEIVHARAEDYRPETAFSTVISRAVGSLNMLVRLAVPMSRNDGRILAMKGSYPAAEIEALGSGVPEAQVHRLEVPALAAPRHLVVFLKTAQAPETAACRRARAAPRIRRNA